MPKYIIYSFRDNNNKGSYLCILDKDGAKTGYYYKRNTYYKKRLSKKLVCFLLPSFYGFEYFNTTGFCTEHEAIFNSDYRRERLQELEGYIFEVYYEIP